MELVPLWPIPSPHPDHNCLDGVRNDQAGLQYCFFLGGGGGGGVRRGEERRGVIVVASAFKNFILKLDEVIPIFLNILVQDGNAYIVSRPICWGNVYLAHERNEIYCRMETIMLTHVDLYSHSSHHLHSMFHSFQKLRWNRKNWHAPNVWVLLAIFQP